MTTGGAHEAPTGDQGEHAPLSTNVVLLAISTILFSLSAFVGNWLIIRWWGRTAHGQVVWVLAVVWIAIHLSDLGIASKWGVRRIARLRAVEPALVGETVTSLVVLQVAVGFALGLAVVALSGVLASSRSGIEPVYFWVAGSWIALSVAARTVVMTATGLERMRVVAFLQPLPEIGKLAIVIVAACWGMDIMGIFLGWTAVYVVTAIAAVILAGRLMRPYRGSDRVHRVSVGVAVRAIREGAPFFVAFLGLACLPLVMHLLIGESQPSEQISYFQVCFSLAVVSRLVSLPLATALFARVASGAAVESRGTETPSEVLPIAARLLGLVATFLFALYGWKGEALLVSLYGSSYAVAAPVLLLLTATMGVENYSLQLDQILLARQHAGKVAWAEAGKYAALLAAAILLIPRLGALGAAASLGLASALNCVVKLFLIRAEVGDAGARSFLHSLVVLAALVAVTAWPQTRPLALVTWLLVALGSRLMRPSELIQCAVAIRRALSLQHPTSRPMR